MILRNLCVILQLLCLVGEAFDDFSDDVCGAVINVRAKGDKVAIWTTNYENKEAVTHIGWVAVHVSTGAVFLLSKCFSSFFFFSKRRVYKERLGVPPKVIIGYQSHADTATKSGSTTKNKFVAWGSSHLHFCHRQRFSVLSHKCGGDKVASFLFFFFVFHSTKAFVERCFCRELFVFVMWSLEMSKRCFGAWKFKHHCLFFPFLDLLSSVQKKKKKIVK